MIRTIVDDIKRDNNIIKKHLIVILVKELGSKKDCFSWSWEVIHSNIYGLTKAGIIMIVESGAVIATHIAEHSTRILTIKFPHSDVHLYTGILSLLIINYIQII